MRFCLALFAVAVLGACQPAAEEPSAPTPSRPNRAPASLVGEYRIAGIDGTEVGGGIGIGLSITDNEIYFEPRCAGFDWSYTYQRGELATDRPGKHSPRLTAGPPQPVCAIAVHPEQRRLATALDAVTRAERTPSNGIELTGGGHSVTLFSQ